MGIVDNISSFVGDQWDQVRDFYGLEYWDDHTLSEGFSEAMHEVSAIVRDASRGRSEFVQASAGASVGLAGLIAGIPIALNEWGIQVTKEIPRGPAAILCRFVEVPASGIIHGIGYVGDAFVGWSRGSLNDRDSFAIAEEVTGVLGAAGLLAYGAKNIANGGGKFMDGLKSAFQGMPIRSPGYGTAVAAVGVQGALQLAGGTNALNGIALMSGTGESGDGNVEAEKAGEGTKPERAETPAVEGPRQVLFHDLLDRYGAKLLMRDQEGASTTLNFRIVRDDKSMAENLSVAHHVTESLVWRVVIRLLLDPMTDWGSVLQRYSGDVLGKLRISGRDMTNASLRIPTSEKIEIKASAQKNSVKMTTAMRLGVRLLTDTLGEQGVVSSSPASTPLRIAANRLKLDPVDIIGNKLQEKPTHVQPIGNDTFIVVTESGAVYRAKVSLDVVLEKITVPD